MVLISCVSSNAQALVFVSRREFIWGCFLGMYGTEHQKEIEYREGRAGVKLLGKTSR
jgi:hypothetical protein